MQQSKTLLKVSGWRCVTVGAPLEFHEWEIDTADLSSDEVVVAVAGCGVCHTDLGFHYDGVRTKKPLPLVLGHEISGRVVAAGKDAIGWLNAAVVIPAVLPCGDCDDCNSGRSNVCRHQVMPGNDVDGGFATHVCIPSLWLVPVPDDFQGELALLSVVADAISTPYQALKRAEVSEGDICVIVGCGGVGGYCAQLAASMGARTVCIDVDKRRLASLSSLGFKWLINSSDMTNREIKTELHRIVSEEGWPKSGWRIFECSGHPAGQTLAFELLGPSGVLAVVGFTMEKVTIRLSNLMAHDGRAFGNWGCQPELYPELLENVVAGAVNIVATTRLRPLEQINEVFAATHHGESSRRTILVPGMTGEGSGQ